ncbi:MAG: hypothetical protein GY751_18095, partial [Bacteroidetes bacterium]|nr:hypothetical protein [Bacteroidota bacterium]
MKNNYFHSSRDLCSVRSKDVVTGCIFFLTLFLLISTPQDISAQAPQGKLCNSYSLVIDKVKWDYWCGDGDCVPSPQPAFHCCGPASAGCRKIPNGVWIGGGMDIRYALEARRISPGTGAWSTRQVYSKNDIGSDGCGNQGYTATFNNGNFGNTWYDECVSQINIDYDVWEEDACFSQTTYNECGPLDNLGNDDECRANADYNETIDPSNTYQDGNLQDVTRNLPITDANDADYCNAYGWIYDLHWDVTRPPVTDVTSVTICPGGTASFQVTGAPEQNGDFVLMTNPLDYGTIQDRITYANWNSGA